MRTCRQQLLRPLRHTDNTERMRPPQTVYTKHRQRIAGYNYLLNVFGCQPIDYFSHKTADFFFSTGAVRRTRSITHINKILVRQHLMQAFQNRQTADSRIKYADWLHFIHKNTLPYFLYFNTLIISLIYVCVYKKQAKKTFFTCFTAIYYLSGCQAAVDSYNAACHKAVGRGRQAADYVSNLTRCGNPL